MGSLTSPKSARHQVSGFMVRGFACAPPYTFTPGQPSPGRATLLRHPFGLPTAGSGRALGRLAPKGSSASHVPTYPGRISLPQEPLVIRRRGFSPLFRYSCLHSHSSGIHGWITPPLPSPPDAPLPTRAPGPLRHPVATIKATAAEAAATKIAIHFSRKGPGYCASATASAVCLSPVTLSAQNHLTSELLRTLSRVAASKPTSWLSLQLYILSHLAHA